MLPRFIQINLSFAVPLYGTTPEQQEAETEWLKKAILAYAADHPDEMADCVRVTGVEELTAKQYADLTPDVAADQADLWANDPRGK